MSCAVLNRSVTVSTPDHHHAHASIAAMRAGKHIYTQKPLTHGIWEARAVRKVAEETGSITQMGNQGASGDGVRRLMEWYNAGLIKSFIPASSIIPAEMGKNCPMKGSKAAAPAAERAMPAMLPARVSKPITSA